MDTSSDTVVVNQSGANVFVVKTASQQEVSSHVISPDRYEGPCVTSTGVTPITEGMNVAAIHLGYIYLQKASGELCLEQLHTHHHLLLARQATANAAAAAAAAAPCYLQCMRMYRIHDVWTMMLRINHRYILGSYAMSCLHLFDIDLAVRAYRLLGYIAMVKLLQHLENCFDKNLLSGYIALIHTDKDKVQRFFFNSANPTATMNMRCDAMRWKQALGLASVARLYVDKNDMPTALRLVLESHSSEPAMLLSTHCVKAGLFTEAIYCLIVARCFKAAFELVQEHNCIDVLVDVLATANREAKAKVTQDEEEKRRGERAQQRKKEREERRKGWDSSVLQGQGGGEGRERRVRLALCV